MSDSSDYHYAADGSRIDGLSESAIAYKEKSLKKSWIPPTPQQQCLFQCTLCLLSAHYEYYGDRPPFAPHVHMLEKAFMLRDPFNQCNSVASKLPLTLGAMCAMCKKTVCVSTKCSIFYSVRLCMTCALMYIEYLPYEIQCDIVKLDMKSINIAIAKCIDDSEQRIRDYLIRLHGDASQQHNHHRHHRNDSCSAPLLYGPSSLPATHGTSDT